MSGKWPFIRGGMGMEIINTDNAREGMVITEDVLNEKGNVLIKKGVALTEYLIGKLKSLGISGVCVENAGEDDRSEEDDRGEDLPPDVSEKLIALEYKFSAVRNNPIMEELLAATKEYITEKGSSDDTD